MKKLYFLLLSVLAFSNADAQYTTSNVMTSLSYPVSFTIAPDGRYFITLKGGGNNPAVNAKVVVYTSAGTLQNTLWDFTDSTQVFFERGVLGVELDPDFTNNNYVYVFYNHLSPNRIRVVRFTESGGAGSNPTIILDISDPHTAGNHTGGNIHFGPDGKLYVTLGDRATSSNSQLLTNPFGKMLRINSDGSIPNDNPYYDDGNPATGNDDRIWAHGLRNSFDFTFSTINDSLYSSENGQNTWDEVNLIKKGANYGWNPCEGFFITGSTVTPCTNPAYELPLDDWGAPLPAVTGIIVYDHPLIPTLQGHLLVADYDNGDITDLTLGNAPFYDTVTARSTMPLSLNGLTDIVQGPEGCIYVMDGGYTSNGKIIKICPIGMSTTENNFSVWMNVYPNPATGNAALVLSENFTGGKYELTDIEGRIVLSGTVMATNTVLPLHGISSGIYFVKATSGKESLTVKLSVH